MRYFIRDASIAAVESSDRADQHVAEGWHEISCDLYVQYWRMRDLRAMYRLRTDAYLERLRLAEQAARRPRERTVGHIY